MKSVYHDAMNSWNGYSHQGKAAIYCVLRMINELKIAIDTSASYELELEHLEDFTIYFQDQEHTIHQVKTYNSSAPSEYKDAVWTLLGKTAMKTSIINAYLHTTQILSDKENLKEKYKTLEAPLPTGSKTQLNPLDYYKYVMDNDVYDASFDKFKLYTYEDDTACCGLVDIQGAIASQIRRYYTDREIFRSAEHHNRVYYFLLSQLDQHISERHFALQERVVTDAIRRISFTAILESLDRDFEQVSKEYYTYVLRELFTSVCEQFLYDQQTEEADSDSYLRVLTFYNDVQKIDDKAFLKLCKKWTPHVRADKLSLNTFHGLIPPNGLRDPLLKALYMFREPLHDDKSVFLKKNASGENIVYLPTTLHDRPTLMIEEDILDEKQIGHIAKEIMLNSDIEDLHEVDVIISSHIPMTSLEEAANKFTKVFPELGSDYAGRSDQDKFMKIKRIKMIPFRRAREELDS